MALQASKIKFRNRSSSRADVEALAPGEAIAWALSRQFAYWVIRDVMRAHTDRKYRVRLGVDDKYYVVREA